MTVHCHLRLTYAVKTKKHVFLINQNGFAKLFMALTKNNHVYTDVNICINHSKALIYDSERYLYSVLLLRYTPVHVYSNIIYIKCNYINRATRICKYEEQGLT